MGRVYSILLLIAFFYGTSVIWNFIGFQTDTPLTVAASKAIFGSLFLWILSPFMKKQDEKIPTYLPAILGITFIALPFFLTSWVQMQLDSSLGSIFIGTTPLWVMLLNCRAEKPTLRTLITLTLGVAALILLFGIRTVTEESRQHLFAESVAVIASLSTAFSFVLMSKHKELSPFHLAKESVSYGAFYLAAVSLLMGKSPLVCTEYAHILIPGFFFWGVGYYLYFRLIQITDPFSVSLSSFIIPFISFIIAIPLMGEIPHMRDLAAFGCVALAFISNRLKHARD